MCPTQNSFDGARKIAEELAQKAIRAMKLPFSSNLLSSEFVEAEGCWIFFLNEQFDLSNIILGQFIFSAYAVAKSGQKSALVYDFRPDREKMQNYADIWSLYALGKKAEAAAALQSFRKKFSW